MKKIIVFLLSILVLVVGVRIINYLLDPPIEYALERKTDTINDDKIYNYGANFKTISKEGLNEFNYKYEDLSISYYGGLLKINDKEVMSVSSVYDYFSIFNDEILVILYNLDDEGNLLIYNYKTDSETVINNYKKMVIEKINPLTFSDEGITVNFTLIKDDRIIGSKKELCKYKDKSKSVEKTLFYEYDKDNKSFKKAQELYSMSLLSYINQYNLCK